MLKAYIRIPLITRLVVAFVLGSLAGWSLWGLGLTPEQMEWTKHVLSPFGQVFVNMLKMVVVPIVFFSLILGAANLPMGQLGKAGAKILTLYLVTSVFAALVGVGIAFFINPGHDNKDLWQNIPGAEKTVVPNLPIEDQGLIKIFLEMFDNPFTSLANNNFLGIIIFSILLGLAFSHIREDKNHPQHRHMTMLLNLLEVINAALHNVVTWIMHYAPIGVFALSFLNFAIYGPAIAGPYIQVVAGIIGGIVVMIFGVYSLMIKLFTGKSPWWFFQRIKEPMLMAFTTRSSAAALPFSLKAASRLGIRDEVAAFALPLGATINMDGVCVHLPMFAVLAINMFGIPVSTTDVGVLVLSTVLAAIGTGGVPGGSLMLLFIVLGSLGVSETQTAVIVSLALGVNPIIDMFETMNNVTGDLVCTYLVDGDRATSRSPSAQNA